MKTITINESNVKAAFEAATNDETKKVLAALFGMAEGEDACKAIPTIDDYTTIKTYEDACKALGEDAQEFSDQLPKHIVALMKLETVSRALWGRNWEPKPQADWDGVTYFYYPWFVLYTEGEVKDIMDSKDHRNIAALFACNAYSGAAAGFGYLRTSNRPAYAHASLGFRLCQETSEKARYFANTFAELWAEYLAFNFTVGERLL